jgi:hypothetical protein
MPEAFQRLHGACDGPLMEAATTPACAEDHSIPPHSID